MLNWSDKEVKQYIVHYFGMDSEYLLIDIYDKSSSGYSIDVRQNNAAIGQGDPNVAPALGFFEVRSDGKLYEMDRITGDYIQVN